MTFELVALTLAAAQAFLLAVLIFQKHRAVYANRFLSWMMLVCGVTVIHILVQDYGVYNHYPGLLFAVLGIPFLVAPLHFLYIEYLLSRADRFRGRDWLHFLPACVIEFAAILTAVAFPSNGMGTSEKDVALAPLRFHIYNWLLVTEGVGYTLAGLSVLLRYRRAIRNVVSSLEEVRLNWLMFITLDALAAWLVFLGESTLLALGINLSNFLITSICAAVYIYAIGYYGLLKSEAFAEPGVGNTMHEIFKAASSSHERRGRYEKSGLDAGSASSLAHKLVGLMDEKKLYRNPTLTLAQVAEVMAITPHNLSEVINTQQKQNFYDFVNCYRVEEVKRNLTDPDKKNLKVLAIAFDAGFNSKASFNEVFKSMTGLTPSEYRKKMAGSRDGG